QVTALADLLDGERTGLRLGGAEVGDHPFERMRDPPDARRVSGLDAPADVAEQVGGVVGEHSYGVAEEIPVVVDALEQFLVVKRARHRNLPWPWPRQARGPPRRTEG